MMATFYESVNTLECSDEDIDEDDEIELLENEYFRHDYKPFELAFEECFPVNDTQSEVELYELEVIVDMCKFFDDLRADLYIIGSELRDDTKRPRDDTSVVDKRRKIEK